MIEIDEAFIDSVAPNANAVRNGRALILKGKFLNFCKSRDETLIFGECRGSGKSGYHTSADFIAPEKPVYRCTCPSRQIPCKHCLGLMYAFVQGQLFQTEEVPEDVTRKRAKILKRAENKKTAAKKPRKVNKSALKKKIKAQMGGLDLLETLTDDLIRGGLGTLNAKTARQIEDQAKQLGNAYLPGAQNALHDFTSLFYDKKNYAREVDSTVREGIYSEALDRLTRLYALCRHGREYLKQRLDDPEQTPATDSAIAAWLGHAWQLSELRELRLMQENAELLQLSFNASDNAARKMFIETGVWANLGNGRIQVTQNFRPYRAAKHIKEDDSVFKVVQARELFVYPGDMNPRIRWEEMRQREPIPSDYQKICSFARREFRPVIKDVKNQLKSPLAEKYPMVLLGYHRIGNVGKDLVMEDAGGQRLALQDTDATDEPATCSLLSLIHPKYLRQQTLLGRFHHNPDTRKLRVKPLSIVTDSEILRLAY